MQRIKEYGKAGIPLFAVAGFCLAVAIGYKSGTLEVSKESVEQVLKIAEFLIGYWGVEVLASWVYDRSTMLSYMPVLGVIFAVHMGVLSIQYVVECTIVCMEQAEELGYLPWGELMLACWGGTLYPRLAIALFLNRTTVKILAESMK